MQFSIIKIPSTHGRHLLAGKRSYELLKDGRVWPYIINSLDRFEQRMFYGNVLRTESRDQIGITYPRPTGRILTWVRSIRFTFPIRDFLFMADHNHGGLEWLFKKPLNEVCLCKQLQKFDGPRVELGMMRSWARHELVRPRLAFRR